MNTDQRGDTPWGDSPPREYIAAYLDATTNPPEQADLVFVPGTRLPDPARIVAELVADGVAPLVLVTGGINRLTGANEAAALRSELVSLGVPHGRILVEDRSTNTLENVVNGWEVTAGWFGAHQITSVVAVCKWMHSRRVLMTLKAHFPAGIRYYARTYAPQGVTRAAWVQQGNIASQAADVMGNWKNIPVYLDQGDIQEIIRCRDGSWM